MKKKFIILHACCLLVLAGLQAQDNHKTSAGKQISKGSEQTDKQLGRKIQQESLGNGKFQHLDSTTTARPAKKKSTRKNKH